MSNAVVTTPGRAAVAALVKQAPLYVAWGSGDVSWGSAPPTPSPDQTELHAEIGRLKVVTSQFVLPADDGTISVGGNLYELSGDPTGYLYIKARFTADLEPTATIREVGIFVGGTVNSSSPGQVYFPDSSVVNSGSLLLLERFAPIVRTAINQEIFAYVLKF